VNEPHVSPWRYVFHLLPPAASDYARQVDGLFYALGAVVAFFTLLIAAAIVGFVFVYRRRPGEPRVHPRSHDNVPLEIAWTLIPFAIALGLFFWSAGLYVQGAAAPEDAEDVLVVGKQWMWKLQHESGAREIDELHVPIGRDIRLVMTSEDVIHSFFVPELRVKRDVLPRRYTYLWFRATRAGSYHLFCAEFCGTQHSRMTGRLVAQAPEEYAAWLASQARQPSPVTVGEALFHELGCPACHRGDEAHRAPVLEGVYGSRVALADGSSVDADDEYLRESVVDPGAKVVTGFTAIMPTYRQSLDDQQLMALVAYLKALGATRRPPSAAAEEAP
jgi:cytochrome c oxidase subunit 2